MRWQALKALVEWENGENEKPRAIRLIFPIIPILIIILLITTSIAIITILFFLQPFISEGQHHSFHDDERTPPGINHQIDGHRRKGKEWGPS